MKKIIAHIFVISLLFLIPLTSDSYCEVKGNCSNCHTMHRSQNPWPWDMNWGGPSSAPIENLLVADCIGCHTNYTDGSPTITLITGSVTVTVPVVYNTVVPPSATLAGGNFYWVAHDDDTKGHNVLGISGMDANLSQAPGNANSCSNSCHYSLAVEQTALPLLGSGCKGCHLHPSHHADDQGPVIDNNPDGEGWYRFLSGHFTGEGHGVTGIEDNDWHATKSVSDHNEYLGYDGGHDAVGAFNELGNTMSAFCCGCHGNFHQERDSFNWIRHASDTIIPNSGEYANAFGAQGSGTGAYNPDIPVARPELTGWTGASVEVSLGAGGDLVMCLSCHRAHGSPYFKLLRWDYRGNDWSGCGTCHTQKQ
ncbi:MAG: cytochrome c3 family protein [Spirochaetota bacterium]|nr:cytochrome c3 family protein [Spirochaetota bacterium]